MIGELKLRFNLDLVLQVVDRTAACDEIWLAVRTSARGREHDPRTRKLCCLLGFGLLGVSGTGRVELLVEPSVSRPRRDPHCRSQLVAKHRRRLGDPTMGGGPKGRIMTAYRQQPLPCAAALSDGPAMPARPDQFSEGARPPQLSSPADQTTCEKEQIKAVAGPRFEPATTAGAAGRRNCDRAAPKGVANVR